MSSVNAGSRVSGEGEGEISVRRKTTMAVLEAYNAWDIDRIMEYRAEDCVQETLPGEQLDL